MQKEFPKWVPYACFSPSGAFRGAWDRGREASPLFLDTTSVYTLRRLPLFKQKTSWRMMYGRFQRLFHSGAVAAGASSVSGGPHGAGP